MDERVEIRCPDRFRKLFLVLIPSYLPQEGMLMEIACYDCARAKRKNGEPVVNVFHYYDSTGACVGTHKALDLPG